MSNVFFRTTWIHQHKVASYWCTKFTQRKRRLWSNELEQRPVTKSSFSRQVQALSVTILLVVPPQAVSVGFHLPWLTYQRKTKGALVHLCLGRTILILANLPKKLQKSMFLSFNSFAHLFVPVRGWLVQQWLAWSDLISSTDVGFSQLPFFADIAITFPPGRALVFCFVLLCFIFLFAFATITYTVDCFFSFF